MSGLEMALTDTLVKLEKFVEAAEARSDRERELADMADELSGLRDAVEEGDVQDDGDEPNGDCQAVVLPADIFKTEEEARAWLRQHSFRDEFLIAVAQGPKGPVEANSGEQDAWVAYQFPGRECKGERREVEMDNGAVGIFCERMERGEIPGVDPSLPGPGPGPALPKKLPCAGCRAKQGRDELGAIDTDDELTSLGEHDLPSLRARKDGDQVRCPKCGTWMTSSQMRCRSCGAQSRRDSKSMHKSLGGGGGYKVYVFGQGELPEHFATAEAADRHGKQLTRGGGQYVVTIDGPTRCVDELCRTRR